MLLHRCSICGKEYLPPGVHATWHKNIGPISKHILREYFCYCKPPRIERSESVITVDYEELNEIIREVGREIKNDKRKN